MLQPFQFSWGLQQRGCSIGGQDLKKNEEKEIDETNTRVGILVSVDEIVRISGELEVLSLDEERVVILGKLPK